jgi:hypothetical protein
VIIAHRVRETADMASSSFTSSPFAIADLALSAGRGRQTPQPDLGATLTHAGAATVGRR